jgi:flavin-binding protein dodecin
LLRLQSCDYLRILAQACTNSKSTEENPMDPVYKKSEVVGTSDKSFAEATRNAVAKAAKTVHNLDWFEVCEMRGLITKGKVAQFQVTIKIGFRLD